MVRHDGKFVSYLRVSTKRQGGAVSASRRSAHAVETFLNGGRWKLVEELVEVESGKDDTTAPSCTRRSKRARSTARHWSSPSSTGSRRDAHFLLGLQKAGVKFVAADMPEANELVVGVMALVAQAERRMIASAPRRRYRRPRRAA